MALKVSQIQNKTMTALRAVGAHILHSTVVALSSEPDDPNYDSSVKINTFIVGAIMTFEQFQTFRSACNLNGIWIKQTHWEVVNDFPKFEYSITATEMRPRFKILLAVLTMATVVMLLLTWMAL